MTAYKIADVIWQIEGADHKLLKGFEVKGKPEVCLRLEDSDTENLLRAMNLALVRDFCGLMLHSSAIVYRSGCYLFVAPAGTGKTTHILLWKKLMGDRVQILNGDKPFVRCVGEEVIAYSSPFQGKEGLGTKGKCRLRGIYILKRSESNRVQPCSGAELVRSLLGATFDFEDEALKLKKLEILNNITKKVPVFLAYCNMETDAAEKVRAHIDGELK